MIEKLIQYYYIMLCALQKLTSNQSPFHMNANWNERIIAKLGLKMYTLKIDRCDTV